MATQPATADRRALRQLGTTLLIATIVAVILAGVAIMAAPARAAPRDHEAGLSRALTQLIASLRARHGAGSVAVISGKEFRTFKDKFGRNLVSCHADGEAFDAKLSAPARADVRARHELGIITYSGAMHHVHVSSCAREAGIRAHSIVNAKGWPVGSTAFAYKPSFRNQE